MSDVEFWLSFRQALLSLVDAVETHKLDGQVQMRTAEIRHEVRACRQTRPTRPKVFPATSSIQPPDLPVTLPPPSLPKM